MTKVEIPTTSPLLLGMTGGSASLSEHTEANAWETTPSPITSDSMREGRTYLTPTYSLKITAVEANEDIAVIEATPQEYHQGEEGPISFRLRNNGSVEYTGIEVIVTGVRNSRDEAFYDESGDSNNITLASGDDGWVSESLRTYGSQRLGDYTLTYYLRFYAEGRTYLTPTYSLNIEVTPAPP